MRKDISIVLVIALVACEKISNLPIAALDVYPSIGDSTTLFEFNAEGSTDDISLSSALEFRWDLDGDGIWDSDYGQNPIMIRYYPFPSIYYITVQVRDRDGLVSQATDSIVVFGKNKNVGKMTDSRNGKSYRIAMIDERWWMAENLEIGVTIDHWTQNQSDNQMVENYLLWSSFRNKYYYAYTWYEAINYKPNNQKGICPEGWHLPSRVEWESLLKIFPIFYANEYYGMDGLSGLNLNDGSNFSIHRGDSALFSFADVGFWSSDHYYSNTHIFYAGSFGFGLGRTGYISYSDEYLDFTDRFQRTLMVRCIKDY